VADADIDQEVSLVLGVCNSHRHQTEAAMTEDHMLISAL